MKLIYKLNAIFMAVAILSASMINIVSAGCHPHSHGEDHATHSNHTVVTAGNCDHCHSDTNPEKENSAEHQCCNNHAPTTGLLSLTNFQVTLLSNFFCPPEKIFPALEFYSTPYIPPQSV